MVMFSGKNALRALAQVKANAEKESLREEVTRGVIKTHARKIEAGEEEPPADIAAKYNYEINETIKMVLEYRRKQARRRQKA